jgi:hypothetical protein
VDERTGFDKSARPHGLRATGARAAERTSAVREGRTSRFGQSHGCPRDSAGEPMDGPHPSHPLDATPVVEPPECGSPGIGPIRSPILARLVRRRASRSGCFRDRQHRIRCGRPQQAAGNGVPEKPTERSPPPR